MNGVSTLHQTLTEELGRRAIERTELPVAVTENLNPAFAVRPYQQRAFQYYLNYWNEPFEGKPRQNHQLLFHMATGSGKTLMMAGLMLHLYTQGYRNVIFFVNSTNIIQKTRDNFLNPLSSKYLFASQLNIGGKRFAIRQVTNFQSANPDDLNVVFSTVQGLHLALNVPQENGITYDDFENHKLVLISDEAHHINVSTRRGDQPTQTELLVATTWEGSVQRIFEANPENVLLEFTATMDFSDENLARKYKSRLIFDYALKDFRRDGYSKEVKVLQADLPNFERALQAVLLSQYRRKIFEQYRLAVKPVILFKSRTIAESKAFFDRFTERMRAITADQIAAMRASAQDPTLKVMFAYFDERSINLENLAAELREDFSEEKLLEVNSKEESETKQLAVNSLESPGNEYRAVFAVDKLNEGWDVLNLFDIVRLYDTRDSRAGGVGRTTMSEAQLIGRGARYYPFRVLPDQPADQCKYDEDLTHEARICEELIYHSAYNPRYIQELNSALREIGIKAQDTRQRTVRLKPSFKATPLYKSGLLFLNERRKHDRSEVNGLDSTVIQKLYRVQLHTGASHSSVVFADGSSAASGIERKQKDCVLIEFGLAVVRTAMQRLDFYEFRNLIAFFPQLDSWLEFACSERYLGRVRVEVSGTADRVENLSPSDKLYVAVKVLEEIAGTIESNKLEYEGTAEFMPVMVKDKITDKTLNFAADEGEDQEFGRSMNDPNDTAIHLDLLARDWYAFEDCFGTSEEKLLIKFVEKHYEALKRKYREAYLIRNERHFKLYNFDDGRPVEPDFVLYLIGRDPDETNHYQIFIEPKGGHLLTKDEWKETFLQRLKEAAVVEQIWSEARYTVWGLPFFNSTLRETEFEASFQELVT